MEPTVIESKPWLPGLEGGDREEKGWKEDGGYFILSLVMMVSSVCIIKIYFVSYICKFIILYGGTDL